MIKSMREFIEKLNSESSKYDFIDYVIASWYEDLMHSSSVYEIDTVSNKLYGLLWAFRGMGVITKEEQDTLDEEITNIRFNKKVSLRTIVVVSEKETEDKAAEPEKEIPDPEKKETALKDKKPEPENKAVETIDDLIKHLKEKNDEYLIFISGFLDTWYDDLGTSLSELNINGAFNCINSALFTLYGMCVITKEERKTLYSEISEVRQNRLRFVSDMAIKKRLDMFDTGLELDL